jgi:hypothetical protein
MKCQLTMSKYPRTHAAKALEAKSAAQRQELREMCARNQRAYEQTAKRSSITWNFKSSHYPNF